MNPALSAKYERFRDLLIKARKSAGLTQAEVASKLNQPQSYVSKYERGERRLDVIEFFEVAEVIGFDALRLLRNLQGPESLAGKRSHK
jgi:transcriptional regulator with XRE-family HTH domain